MFDQPGEEFLHHSNGSPEEIVLICLAKKNWECILKLILAS
jgi:hypothetical protein